MATKKKTTAPIRAFKDAEALDAWLAKNQNAAAGIWIKRMRTFIEMLEKGETIH